VEFSVVRIQEPFVLYRAYLWLPLFFLLIPALTSAVSNRVFWVVILAIAAAFAVASNDRLNSFSSNYALWDDAVRKLPENPGPVAARAYNNRCQQNLRRGELKMAIADCNEAVKLNPKYRLSYQNRAFVLMKSGEFDAAIKDAQTVFQMHPKDPHAHTLLGVTYQGAGRIDEAKASFNTGCDLGSLPACVELKHLEAAGAGGNMLQK
jgi:protein O-mannosyl-transferase